MERGDPKQLAVLGVMAVGAIGFLISRVGGKTVATFAKAPATAHSTSASPSRLLLAALTNDPFSHRKLAPADPIHLGQPQEELSSLKVKPATPMTGAPAGPLPLAGAFSSPSWDPLVPHLKGVVKHKAKEAPERVAPVATTAIGLEAIASASDTVAFLTIGGAESQPYRLNDRIHGEIRLTRIGDGTVVLSGPKGELTLEVGEQKRI